MLIFKLPFKEKIFITDGNSDQNFVSFFSFNGSNNYDFQGNITEISQEELLKTEIFSEKLKHISEDFVEETQEEYLLKLEKTINFIQENQLKKMVISRRKAIDYQNISLTRTFLSLCKNYPNAFAYCFIKDEYCWLGAFSEVLGKFNKKTSEFQTMSLAGTLPANEEWTSKEIEEQKPVTEYILNILKNFSENVEISETYNHFSGNIKHLRTDFKTKISAENLEKLISELHPTPAVCGIPKDFCKTAIENFEKYPREFYAGYTKVETDEEICYYVNLRCGKFYKNTAHLFVGGGITKDSIPENEWCETELKAEAVAKNLVFRQA